MASWCARLPRWAHQVWSGFRHRPAVGPGHDAREFTPSLSSAFAPVHDTVSQSGQSRPRTQPFFSSTSMSRVRLDSYVCALSHGSFWCDVDVTDTWNAPFVLLQPTFSLSAASDCHRMNFYSKSSKSLQQPLLQSEPPGRHLLSP